MFQQIILCHLMEEDHALQQRILKRRRRAMWNASNLPTCVSCLDIFVINVSIYLYCIIAYISEKLSSFKTGFQIGITNNWNCFKDNTHTAGASLSHGFENVGFWRLPMAGR